jgi:hypothetical protein
MQTRSQTRQSLPRRRKNFPKVRARFVDAQGVNRKFKPAMTIPSSSKGFSLPPSQAVKPERTPANQPVAAQDSPEATLQSSNFDALREAIASPPKLRPLEAARAIIWAKDPNYPPLDKLNNIAGMFLAEAIRNL